MSVRFATPAVVLLLLTGCTLTVEGPTPSTPVSPAVTSSQAAPASSPAPASPAVSSGGTPTTAGTATASRTWTHQLVSSATRRADATAATVKGGRVFPQSTSLWAGCDGTTDEVKLALDGTARTLVGELALRDSVPAGIVVHTLVLVDGRAVQNIQLDAADTRTVPVNVVLTGARSVTFRSTVVQGTCGPSQESYAVLGDGYVE